VVYRFGQRFCLLGRKLAAARGEYESQKISAFSGSRHGVFHP
jgi:hypothetical protein